MIFFVQCLIAILGVFAIVAAIVFIRDILDNPYEFYYFEYEFDVSSKRNVNIEDLKGAKII